MKKFRGESKLGYSKESFAKHEVTFTNPPAEVAERLQVIISEIGKIKTVSRETGQIQAVIKKGVSFGTSPQCTVSIGSDSNGTIVKLELNCTESALVNYHRSEKALAILLSEIGNDHTLVTATNTGW